MESLCIPLAKLEQFPEFQAQDRLRHLLSIVWGQDFAKDMPLTLKEQMIEYGVNPDNPPTLKEYVQRVNASIPAEPLPERIWIALDLIFAQRYNWPEGTA